MSLEQFKRVDQRIKDLVFGFIHETQKLLPSEDNHCVVIPDLIIHICLAFYYIRHTWQIIIIKENTKIRDLKLSDDDRKVTKIEYDTSRTVYSKNLVYTGIHHWRIKIVKLAVSGNWTVIGIARKTNDDRGLIQSTMNIFTNPYGNGFCRYGYIVNFEKIVNSHKGIQEKYGVKCKEGDIVEMIFDADKCELKYIVNDIDQGIAYDNTNLFKGEYYACVTFPTKGDSVEFV